MKTWLTHHRRALRNALRRIFAAPMSTLLSMVVIGMTLSLPAGLYHLLQVGTRALGESQIDPEISVFAKLDTTSTQVAELQQKLAADPAVADVRFVSRTDALERLQKSMDTADLLEGIDRNPLPDAFIIRAKTSEPNALAKLRDRLAQLANVEHARIDLEWARTLASTLRLAQRTTLIIAIGLCAGLVLVVGNTIRLQLVDAKDEIDFSRLIGATSRYVRRPYLYFGALQGFIGGLIAAGLVWLALTLFDRSAAELFDLAKFSVQPPRLAANHAALLVALATLLGWLGAYLSVQSHLWRHKQ